MTLAVLPNMDTLAVVPKRFFDGHGPRIGLVALEMEKSLPPSMIHLFTQTDSPLTLPTQRLLNAILHEAQVLQLNKLESPDLESDKAQLKR